MTPDVLCAIVFGMLATLLQIAVIIQGVRPSKQGTLPTTDGSRPKLTKFRCADRYTKTHTRWYGM